MHKTLYSCRIIMPRTLTMLNWGQYSLLGLYGRDEWIMHSLEQISSIIDRHQVEVITK